MNAVEEISLEDIVLLMVRFFSGRSERSENCLEKHYQTSAQRQGSYATK